MSEKKVPHSRDCISTEMPTCRSCSWITVATRLRTSFCDVLYVNRRRGRGPSPSGSGNPASSRSRRARAGSNGTAGRSGSCAQDPGGRIEETMSARPFQIVRTIVSRSIARAIARRTLSSDSARSRRLKPRYVTFPPGPSSTTSRPASVRCREQVGVDPVEGEVHASHLQFEEADVAVGDELDRHRPDRGRTAVIPVVCGKDRLAVGREVVDPVGTRPDGRRVAARRTSCGDDPAHHRGEERGERLGEAEDDGPRVGGLDRGKVPVEPPVGGPVRGVEDPREGVPHVGGGERTPVVEPQPRPKVEYIGRGSGDSHRCARSGRGSPAPSRPTREACVIWRICSP